MKLLLFFTFISVNSWAGFLPKSFSIDVEQRHVSKIRKKVKVSTGEIKYSYPSKIYFDVKKPEPILYVSNGKKTWIYRPPFMKGENGTVEVFSSINSEGSKFFDALMNGLKDNEMYQVKVDKNIATLSFTKKAAKKLNLKTAILEFKDEKNMNFSKLTKMTWEYNSNKPKLDLIITKVIEKPMFESSQFIFEPPKNTTIKRRD
jgi:outer membrane lipoprotein-sorting protein